MSLYIFESNYSIDPKVFSGTKGSLRVDSDNHRITMGEVPIGERLMVSLCVLNKLLQLPLAVHLKTLQEVSVFSGLLASSSPDHGAPQYQLVAQRLDQLYRERLMIEAQWLEAVPEKKIRYAPPRTQVQRKVASPYDFLEELTRSELIDKLTLPIATAIDQLWQWSVVYSKEGQEEERQWAMDIAVALQDVSDVLQEGLATGRRWVPSYQTVMGMLNTLDTKSLFPELFSALCYGIWLRFGCPEGDPQFGEHKLEEDPSLATGAGEAVANIWVSRAFEKLIDNLTNDREDLIQALKGAVAVATPRAISKPTKRQVDLLNKLGLTGFDPYQVTLKILTETLLKAVEHLIRMVGGDSRLCLTHLELQGIKLLTLHPLRTHVSD